MGESGVCGINNRLSLSVCCVCKESGVKAFATSEMDKAVVAMVVVTVMCLAGYSDVLVGGPV